MPLRVLERAVTSQSAFTAADLQRAAVAIAANIKSAAEEINRQDGQLGDGDLGITVTSGWQAVADIAKSFPDDIGQSFLAAAKAFQRVSSSSFGTMAASAFMAVAKRTQGRTSAPWTEIPDLIAAARDAMIARGKGALGDKTVLDSLDAVRAALVGLDDPATMRAAAVSAAEKALNDFRDSPNRLGRARMYGERSIGLDDPGMLAFSRILSSLPEAV
jgi:phosphoenolpyruvate---glycerone phosphotransferase subunit DhaL